MKEKELLKPRYKVIAEDTSGNYKIGEIYYQHGNDGGFGSGIYYTTSPEDIFPEKLHLPAHIEKFPHLFRKLEWWEEREAGDMPKYVKNDQGKVYKVSKYEPYIIDKSQIAVYLDGRDYSTHVRNFQPATEAEYNQSIANKIH